MEDYIGPRAGQYEVKNPGVAGNRTPAIQFVADYYND
jgi:hypothetical protein